MGWAIGYDPIVTFTALASGLETGTYVDGTALLLIGVRSFVVALLTMFVLCKAAGLHLAMHTCEHLYVVMSPAAAKLLRYLPLRLRRIDHQVTSSPSHVSTLGTRLKGSTARGR